MFDLPIKQQKSFSASRPGANVALEEEIIVLKLLLVFLTQKIIQFLKFLKLLLMPEGR
jgi:hypothetical protein